jgi:short-subunit dehydrogenase
MTKDNKGMFWVASAEKAALQIYNAIRKKKDVAYITKRWSLIGGLMKAIPRSLAKRL